jgi:hypothetical protein
MLSNLTLGPFSFAAPLALAGLIALPVIWWLLRASPPRPQVEALPSLRLLDGVEEDDTTPSRTPLWVLLIRMAAAALAILGLALPTYDPDARTAMDGATDPLLIVLDDGWQAAPRWSERIDATEAILRDAPRDTGVHILTLAPQERAIDPAERFSRQEAEARLKSLEPASWPSEPSEALARFEAADIEPARTVWISSGIETGGTRELARALADMANLEVRVFQPRTAFAFTGLSAEAGGARVEVRRLASDEAAEVPVSARALDATPIASAVAAFAPGDSVTEAEFELPTAALNRINLFTLPNTQGSASVWLWDSSAKRQRVGLVSPGSLAQPLLEDVYYVRKALEPFAEVTEDDLPTLISMDPDAIVLTDTGALAPDMKDAVEEWVRDGGALIRFAGPRLAGMDTPAFVPVPIRRTARALGGALNWDTPQGFEAFTADSPFAGLPVPAEAKVRQQVLAQPTPDLASKTWARLEDGSPIITATGVGTGTLILFHVTASPEWSDLPYTGTFVELLRRSIAAGRGQSTEDASEGNYVPRLVLNGAGRLVQPEAEATPIAGENFFAAPISQQNPPGFYEGPAGLRARNAAAGEEPARFTDWPASAVLLGDTAPVNRPLAGPLLAAALALVALDLFIALYVAGRFRKSARAVAGLAAGLIVSGLLLAPPPAAAQFRQPLNQNPSEEPLSKLEEATEQLRFAYVLTGDRDLDELSAAGLFGLSLTLYRRTSVEPGMPHGVDLEDDALEVYPLIFLALPDAPTPLSAEAVANLNRYMASGGLLIIDTRRGGSPNTDSARPLEGFMNGINIEALVPVPSDHVLRRSYYLLEEFPGRYASPRVWIETSAAETAAEMGTSNVSRVLLGAGDWASAWAVDERGRPLKTVDGGEGQREMARRAGVNFAMYALTGTYKDDGVHMPELLKRLGQDQDVLPTSIGNDDEGDGSE